MCFHIKILYYHFSTYFRCFTLSEHFINSPSKQVPSLFPETAKIGQHNSPPSCVCVLSNLTNPMKWLVLNGEWETRDWITQICKNSSKSLNSHNNDLKFLLIFWCVIDLLIWLDAPKPSRTPIYSGQLCQLSLEKGYRLLVILNLILISLSISVGVWFNSASQTN